MSGMVKYRPSKSFLLTMAGMVPVGAVLVFGLLPELEAISKPPVPGVIIFPATRPMDSPTTARQSGGPRSSGGGWSLDWLQGHYENLMAWDRNPWKRRKTGFGDHYFDLLASTNPADRAKAAEIRKQAQFLYQQVLKRYPELAVTLREVPAERNGFLQLLDLLERFQADPARRLPRDVPALQLPESLTKFLSGSGPWDPAEARAWLAKEKALLDEVRAIGLLPEQSSAGIDVNRYSFFSARVVKGFSDALLLEARLAAEEGNVAGALDAIRAAKGVGDHIGKIETPSLLSVTVQILLNLQVQSQVVSHIIPALPPGQFDPAAWEAAVRPEVLPPSEYSRIMKGEWHIGVQQYILPIACDVEDPKYAPDPEALIDFYSGRFAEVVATHDKPAIAEWATVAVPAPPTTGHLSRSNRQAAEMMFVGEQAWSKGLLRAMHSTGMTNAAFAMMKGQPIPADPIHGLPYVWDPATRQLSPPADPVFEEQQLKPITVPAR